MRHEPLMLSDVPAKVSEIVRIRVVAVESERKDRQADVARIARAVNDPCSRQHQGDEP